MKAWMTTLVAFLGLGAATAWSAEPAPLAPAPVAVASGCGAGSGCGSCGPSKTSCGGCNTCCSRGGNLVDFLLFCPNKTPCRGICPVPRNAPPYAYLYTYPTYERCLGCGTPAESCSFIGHGCWFGGLFGCSTGSCASGCSKTVPACHVEK